MDKKDYSNWENDVNGMIKGVMDSIDLTDIKKNINTTMKDLEVVLKNQTNNVKNQTEHVKAQANYAKTQVNNVKTQVGYGSRNIINKVVKNEVVPVPRNVPGNTASILSIIFGSIGTVVFIPLFLTFFLLKIISGTGVPFGVSLGIFLPLLLVSTFTLKYGISVRGRISRFKTYLNLIRNRSFCKIKELSDSLGKSERFIIQDLQRMISRRMFLEAHIDKEQKYVILNHKTYDQYLLTEVERRKLISQETVDKAPKSEVDEVITRGRDYINQIKAANDAIEGEEISNKLSQLELVTTRIFTYVEKNPGKLSEIHKFMDYYLPTTLKLVVAYQEFDSHSFEGETIVKAKEEIVQTLDTINLAFENLFDSLFEDTAMDISTDISMLHALLAQDGLTNSAFRTESNKNNDRGLS